MDQLKVEKSGKITLFKRRDFAMRKSRFTEQQIAFALRQAETGTKVSEVCRKIGVAEPTFYNWKKKYGGLGVSELRRLKQLVADLSLDKQMLQDVITKKL